MKPSVVVLAVAVSVFALPAQAAESIVGLWGAPETDSCSLDDNATRIGPMSLTNLDVACRFSSVQRQGDVVTWQGVCDDAEGSSAQTVTGTLTNGRLTISYAPGGNTIENLKRCK